MVKLGELLADCKLVFFDCDGVLLDSNGVKLAAVDHALAAYPALLRERCKDSFRLNFGRPRRWHFEAFQRLIGVAQEEDFVATSIARYEQYLQAHYRYSPAVAGAPHLLARLTARGVICTVVSGGVEAEINAALAECGMDRLLARVVGSPVTKIAAINALLEQYDCSAAQAVFLGDASADAEAAIACKVPFIFVSGHALIARSTLSASWPEGHWGGEVPNLLADNAVSRFCVSSQTIKEES